MAETESDGGSIATDSTRTLLRKIFRAQWTLIHSFSREQHSDAEIKVWIRQSSQRPQVVPWRIHLN